MDIVYPVKQKDDNEELRHSLRSLVNLPHERVWIAGYTPSWTEHVERIKVAQRDSKYRNLCANIRAACEHPEVSDPFILFNDDFFVLEPITEVPTHWRETVRDAITRYGRRRRMDNWRTAMRKARKLLREEGIDDPLSYELHIPIVVNKKSMLQALDLMPPNPIWRTLYGNLHGIGGTQLRDVKHANGKLPQQGDAFASSNDNRFSNGELGDWLKQAFPDKGHYEKARGKPCVR